MLLLIPSSVTIEASTSATTRLISANVLSPVVIETSNDDRYKDLIGKNVILPILNKPIPIVGDEHADRFHQYAERIQLHTATP